MIARRILLSALLMVAASPGALAEGDPARGAKIYRACASCHALEPGLHLSGPSLANIVGRQAGAADGFARYSPGLKSAEFDWDEAALDAWLVDPRAMIPGTYMVFAGLDDPDDRADLIAFLELVGRPGGAEAALDDGVFPKAYLRGPAPRPTRDAPARARTTAIRHCGDSYFIRSEDGRETPYWEKNVRLKIDSADTGPPAGVGVILRSGMAGDRISVVFASLADLTAIIEEKC